MDTVRPTETPAWTAFLLATAPALASVILIETALVVAALSGPFLDHILGTLGEVTRSGTRQLGPAIAIALGQTLSLALLALSRRWRWAPRLLLCALSLGQVHLVWLVAIEAPYLARDFNVRAIFSITGAIYAALALWVSSSSPRLVTVRVWLGGGIALASLVIAAIHYRFFVGLYPTLHSSLAMFGFLGVHLGLSMVLTGRRRRRLAAGALLGAPVAILLLGVLAPAPATARGRPVVAAHSALVRPALIAETPAKLLRPSSPPHRRDRGPVRPDELALARFSEASGLPPLPETFRLEDHDVLFVVIDALRRDRTSLARAELATTPAMVELRERGAFDLTRAFSPSNGTYPSLTSLLSMTTLSFARHEIHGRHWHGRLRPEQRTAPEALSEAGFRTFWEGFNFKRVMTIRVHGLTERFDRHHLELIFPGRDLDADARVVNRAIGEIRSARASGQPYFGLVHLPAPHDDYQRHFPRMPSATPRDIYDQEVRYADSQLRRLLDEVGRGGAMDRTVVIITADHGEAFEEHGHRFHLSSLYDEQVHVPLLIWVPGLGGRRLEGPTSITYVLPWLLLRGPEAARTAAEQALREDLGPLLRETGGAVLSEFISRQRQQATLRYPDYTVYYDIMADYFGIFDARRDPGEHHDLREERPELVDRFTAKVQAFRRARFAGQRYFFTDPPEPAEAP